MKRDLKAEQTGNVAVETAHNGQPSGILTTQATWWVIVLQREAIIIKADALRKLVLSGEFREVAAGDSLASRVKLVPVAKLKAVRGKEATVIPLPELAATSAS